MGPQRLFLLGSVALPVIGVLVASNLGAGARAAVAATPLAPPIEVPSLPAERPRLDPIQTAAAVYSRSLREQGNLETPFYVVSTASAASVIESDRPVEPVEAEPIPQFHLTSILKGKQPVATINGRLRRSGDQIGGGWSIREIDPAAGTATLTAPGRESVVVRLR